MRHKFQTIRTLNVVKFNKKPISRYTAHVKESERWTQEHSGVRKENTVT